MKLKLFHGRKDPNEEMNDWGEEGPTLEGVKYAHTTYHYRTVVCFNSIEAMQAAALKTGWKRVDENTLEITYDNDMIYADYRWYGDWSFYEEA